jgi:hypothetical protein
MRFNPKSIEKCFNVILKVEPAVAPNDNYYEENHYQFAVGLPNPEIVVRSHKFSDKHQIILATGLIEHVIYQGSEKELERQMKRIAMESALKDETTMQEPIFDDEEDEDE